MAVRTTSTDSRGFERDRKVDNVRLKDDAGWAAAAVVRIEEASGGIDDGFIASELCCFRSCLRRWGGRSWRDCSTG